MRFLEKVYSRLHIEKAFEWRGLTAPTSDLPAEFKPEEKAELAKADDGIAF